MTDEPVEGAVCGDCGGSMIEVDSCTRTQLTLADGQPYERVRYGAEDAFEYELEGLPPGEEPWCHDCAVRREGIHHFGCDYEECPRCGEQLISCGHLAAGEQEKV